MENKINDMLELIGNGEATISIKKGKGLQIDAKGPRLAVLIALASAEKYLLKELNCDNKEFDLMKQIAQIMGDSNE